MLKSVLMTAAAAMVALTTMTSVATSATVTSLSDNFDSETQALNYGAFANWNVSNGTVDVIGTPGRFPLCDSANCVDLDGSTSNAGDLTTKDTFAAGTYELSFRLAGNQRRSSLNDGVDISFGGLIATLTKAHNDPFQLYTYIVTLASADYLSFSHAGGDNIGLLLDDVNVTAVPLPAALPLYGAGLAAMGFVGWRRKQKLAKT